MSGPLAVARQMMDAWEALDWDAVTALFADDGVLEIVPIRKAYRGHADIHSHLLEVAGGIESLTFDIKTLCASGDTVTFERDDVFVYNGRAARVPCVGVMQISNAKVSHWREYFDGGAMRRAVGMTT